MLFLEQLKKKILISIINLNKYIIICLMKDCNYNFNWNFWDYFLLDKIDYYRDLDALIQNTSHI